MDLIYYIIGFAGNLLEETIIANTIKFTYLKLLLVLMLRELDSGKSQVKLKINIFIMYGKFQRETKKLLRGLSKDIKYNLI